CAAVAPLYGAAGVEQFPHRAGADPEVRSLRARVTTTADERLDTAAVVVDIDGRERHAELRPTMSDAELEAKVRSLAGAHADEYLAWVAALDGAAAVRLPSDWWPRRR